MSKVLTSTETCPKRWKPLASCSSLSPRILLLKSWLRRFHERKQQIGGKRRDLERKQQHWRQDWETRIAMKANKENINTPQPSPSSVMLQPAGCTAHVITTVISTFRKIWTKLQLVSSSRWAVDDYDQDSVRQHKGLRTRWLAACTVARISSHQRAWLEANPWSFQQSRFLSSETSLTVLSLQYPSTSRGRRRYPVTQSFGNLISPGLQS